MEMCAKCGVNPAVIFVTKIEQNQTTSEGLCLVCAKKMGISQIDGMLEKMGIGDEEIDSLTNQMRTLSEELNELTENGENPDGIFGALGEDPDEEGGAPAAPLGFLKNIFGGDNKPAERNEKRDDSNGSAGRGKKEKNARSFGGKKSMLDTYGIDLTAKAEMGEVDKVLNREAEIERVIQILNRRSKNNPVLLGEPGVGKTAIAEGLARQIFLKQVPPKMFGYRVYLVDFTALVAGTQFRGQFEARLKNLLKEAADRGNVILVIDEIHNIVAAGDAEGAMSAGNILKPALARGEIQIIGATTLNEYRKFIEKDSALERRFQPVIVDEPSIASSIEILKGVKEYYEQYHTVKISDDIVEKAVRMSERYITDRFLPDKAIDVIDEAGSMVNLKNKALYDAAQLKRQIEDVEAKVAEANESQNYEESAKLRAEEFRLKEQYEAADKAAHEAEITFDDIAAVIENWTKIPVHNLTVSETEKLLNLEERIHKRVIGQEEAVNAVARAIRRGRADINVKKRPVSFIFAGPTGVGKTELVKTIAEIMFDSEEALIRIDMSEYMEKHSVSKLIGSPPGYVGYDDAGQLTEKVRRKPYSVILLDEIEKAHPEVFNLFLQILDDGRVADSHGKIVNFENTIIIMTTNAGSEFRSNAMGFAGSDEITAEDNVQKSLKQYFRPEFLNRIDEIVTFKSLKKEELKQIIDLLLKDITSKIEEKGAQLNVTDDAKELILEKGYDVKNGARPLKRAIQKYLEDELAQLSLTGGIKPGAVIAADAKDGKIVLYVN